MVQEFPLAAYSDDPIYNMKAATQRTGIPAATLRAWERRYKVLEPSRTEGNYRLYSDRDIAILIWLKAQLDAGLSISRAVALLERLRADMDMKTLRTGSAPAADEAPPGAIPSGVAISATPQTSRAAHALHTWMDKPDTATAQTWDRLKAALYAALTRMDEQAASVTLAEAFALYPVETVCMHVITPCMVAIGQDWFDGKISVVTEHFATAYLMGRLLALLNAQPVHQGPLALIGCAPTERHEVGAMMVALLLRRAGYNVRYLGSDIPLVELARAVRELKPRVLAVSAMMSESAQFLLDLPRHLANESSRTQLVFGGRAFSINRDLAAHLNDSIVATDIVDGIARIERLLS